MLSIFLLQNLVDGDSTVELSKMTEMKVSLLSFRGLD